MLWMQRESFLCHSFVFFPFLSVFPISFNDFHAHWLLSRMCRIKSEINKLEKWNSSLPLLRTLVRIYTCLQKTTNTNNVCFFFPKELHPTGKWIFWTSLKSLIAFIVSPCFAFINRLGCQIHQLLFCAFYLLWSPISAFCHDNNVQIAPFIIVFLMEKLHKISTL